METKNRLVEECISIRKKLIGMGQDTWNESVSEDESGEEC
jgi:hypothetical protein